MRTKLFPFAAILLVSCASLKQRAETLMTGGVYSEALSVYEEMLAKDPKDADALVGQKLAREKLIDTKLIEVRLSRMGGNEQNSLDLLLELCKLENTWKFYPKDKVAFTQEEESGFALDFIKLKTTKFLGNRHPMPAALLLAKYRPIFDGIRLPALALVEKQVRLVGEKQCDRRICQRTDQDLALLQLLRQAVLPLLGQGFTRHCL